jgi:hypothetical protein
MSKPMEDFTDQNGTVHRIHNKKSCRGNHCPFHNPSDHRLKDAPMNIRYDKGGLVERICEHGIGHDDPDSVAFFVRINDRWVTSLHGCCGCCNKNIKSS